MSTSNTCTLTWEGKTDCLPSSSPVYLQIYNHNSSSWETVDSNNLSAVNTNFILTASISNTANYVNVDDVISCRVWQLAI